MPFKLKIENRGALKSLSVELPSKLRSIGGERLNRILLATAYDIAGTAKESIQTGIRSGRVYRKKSGRLHRASAPGEFPASDTGQLASSILAESIPDGAVVGSVVKHGLFLEEGTVRMSKRPWLLPSVDMNIPKLEQRVNAMMEEL